MNSPSSENSRITGYKDSSSRREYPNNVPLRKMFSRPGEVGVEAGAELRAATTPTPATRKRPEVGSVVPERILRRVDLPAPFCPTTPSAPRRAPPES